MCTLVIASSVLPSLPVVVVANRDERLDRPASGPQIWPADDGGEHFLAPRDELAGGSWLGVNTAGVFVGITNRYLVARDDARRSRGELVTRALRLPSARAIHAAMRQLDPADYNGFHLVYADGRDVLATASDGNALAQLTLGHGVQVITERSFGAGDDHPRVRRVERAWERCLVDERARTSLPEALTDLLVEHDDADPLSATCIHLPALAYGTRSAMVLALGVRAPSEPPVGHLLWAEGPPCTTAFTSKDALLASVLESRAHERTA